jgi:hypothetical protein
MTVHTQNTLNSHIEAYLEQPGSVSATQLRGFANTFRAMPYEDRKQLFKSLHIRNIKGEFPQRRFVSLLFCLAKQLQWHQPAIFTTLEQSWQQHGQEAGYAQLMINCLRQLTLAGR